MNKSIQINQTTRCNSFYSLLIDVYLKFNTFRASSRPSSVATDDGREDARNMLSCK
jgi:hypothetical protein